jgi:hypothetical protein
MPERGCAPMAHTHRGDALVCRQGPIESVNVQHLMSSEADYASAIMGPNRVGAPEPGSFHGVT